MSAIYTFDRRSSITYTQFALLLKPSLELFSKEQIVLENIPYEGLILNEVVFLKNRLWSITTRNDRAECLSAFGRIINQS